jgi:hypothetical protein
VKNQNGDLDAYSVGDLLNEVAPYAIFVYETEDHPIRPSLLVHLQAEICDYFRMIRCY